ncbi:MAG: type II toxin-antitoxin system PemK/MazF family toxin [Oscillospiraceae bacterium]|nr:type II toxin-antitoxin system PemK/MazF family toxin [Oscillospiraceae bacterium]
MDNVNVGDIILVRDYKDGNRSISGHSFVVISSEAGEVKGLEYDVICNVLSSFKGEEQRKRKLGYPGNFEISHKDSSVPGGNDKDGYIKAEQFYFFKLDKIDYSVIGKLDDEVLKKLLLFIADFISVKLIVDNL